MAGHDITDEKHGTKMNTTKTTATNKVKERQASGSRRTPQQRKLIQNEFRGEIIFVMVWSQGLRTLLWLSVHADLGELKRLPPSPGVQLLRGWLLLIVARRLITLSIGEVEKWLHGRWAADVLPPPERRSYSASILRHTKSLRVQYLAGPRLAERN